jgi:hypothetical protein
LDICFLFLFYNNKSATSLILSYLVKIYMHSALTWVQVLVTHTPEHANWLAHFLLGFTYCDDRKWKATEKSYLDARSSVTFLRSFILWQQGTCFFVWLWYKRERTSKHSAIWYIFGGYAPSYKSDSLVFRCSFYYLSLWINVIKYAIFTY